MAQLSIYQDAKADYTVVPNRFIDTFMPSANDAQLKIYLYLLRVLSAHQTTSISDIADIFNYTEKDVMRALKYWEKNQLLALDYDDAKSLTGIHFLDADKPSSILPEPVMSAIPTMSTLSATPALSSAGHTEQTTQASVVSLSYVKPNYSAEDLKAFRSNEATSRLLFITEQYLKKTLSPSEVRSVLFISDRLGFSEDLIDYLIQYCVDRGKKDLRYIEKVAISWAEQGITTPRQAAALAGKYEKYVYEIMKALGKNGTPTKTEAGFITRWVKELGFTTDVIYAACERTVLATDKHRFEYADKILDSWHKAGVHHVTDIRTLDESYHRSKPPRQLSVNAFNQFQQNEYDFSALEKELLSN